MILDFRLTRLLYMFKAPNCKWADQHKSYIWADLYHKLTPVDHSSPQIQPSDRFWSFKGIAIFSLRLFSLSQEWL